ncbi:hypothetical protein BKA81DRAFT_399246 [Phyllosticta paracitricarpa]
MSASVIHGLIVAPAKSLVSTVQGEIEQPSPLLSHFFNDIHVLQPDEEESVKINYLLDTAKVLLNLCLPAQHTTTPFPGRRGEAEQDVNASVISCHRRRGRRRQTRKTGEQL